MGEEYSDEERESVTEQIEAWSAEFASSEYFSPLNDEQKESAGFVIQSFSDYMFSYQGVTPPEWSPSDLEAVCVEILPRKVSAEADFYRSVTPVLLAFFAFLQAKGEIKNAPALCKRLSAIDAEMQESANDPRQWGPAKGFMMQALAAGVDPADRTQMNKFMAKYNESLMQSRERSRSSALESFRWPVATPMRNQKKIGRNQFCPCQSGKKYKKCCGSQSPDVSVSS